MFFIDTYSVPASDPRKLMSAPITKNLLPDPQLRNFIVPIPMATPKPERRLIKGSFADGKVAPYFGCAELQTVEDVLVGTKIGVINAIRPSSPP